MSVVSSMVALTLKNSTLHRVCHLNLWVNASAKSGQIIEGVIEMTTEAVIV